MEPPFVGSSFEQRLVDTSVMTTIKQGIYRGLRFAIVFLPKCGYVAEEQYQSSSHPRFRYTMRVLLLDSVQSLMSEGGGGIKINSSKGASDLALRCRCADAQAVRDMLHGQGKKKKRNRGGSLSITERHFVLPFHDCTTSCTSKQFPIRTENYS
jgi:hypothetical protein